MAGKRTTKDKTRRNLRPAVTPNFPPETRPTILFALQILEGINDPAVIYDLRRVAAGANSAARNSFGFDPTGMARGTVARKLSLRTPPIRGTGKPYRTLERGLAGKIVRGREGHFLDGQGEERTVLISARPIRAGRKIIGAQEVWRDLTGERRLENSLQTSELRYRSLFEESQSYNVVIGPDETIRDLNQLMLKILASRKSEVIGRPFLGFIPSEERKRVRDALRKFLAGKLVHNVDIPIRARDGSRRAIMFSPKKIIIREKEILLGTLFTGMDITERKLAEEAIVRDNTDLEEQVEKRTGELRQAHRLLEKIFSTTEFLLAYLDRNFNFLQVNRAYAEAGGRTPDFFVGKNHFQLYPHPKNEEIFRRVKSTDQPYFAHARFFPYPSPPTQEITYWDWSLQPVRKKGKKADGFLLTLVDVTRRRKAEVELARMQVDMVNAKRLSAIGTLAATVAHELRSPLGTIGLATANLRRKTQDPALDSHLENIRRKVSESDRIISNLLSYARIKLPRWEPVRLDRLATEALETVGERFSRMQVRLVADLAALQKTPAEADKVQLLEIFTNVITNAYQAIDKPAGRIRVAGRIDHGSTAVITIRDNGEGLAEEEIKRVFEPFYSRKPTGTGLGLALSKELIELHGGSIILASQKGRGTTVTITLPLRKDGAPLRLRSPQKLFSMNP